MNRILIFLYITIPLQAFTQNSGQVSGTVKDRNTQQVLVGASVALFGPDTVKTRTDEEGNFKLSAAVGRYQVVVSSLGYASTILYNINLTSGNAQILSIEMDPDSESLDEVVISSGRTARATDMITPLSTQKLTAEEIKLNPGGNFDVSKVIQALPGVAGGTSPNRNDIIVRGGGPAENVYYLDGIEIPVLNHFQTQGASGGATGILNVSFINDVQLSSSAFDSRYDNALASTFVIKQRNGNPNKFGGNIRLSGSELASTFEGPLGKNTTFLASARRSYLQ